MILLTIGSGIAYFLVVKKQIRQSEQVAHTIKVINLTEAVQTLMIDMETGNRGYRVTQNAAFLQPYTTAIVKIGPALTDLQNEIGNDSNQLKTIASLRLHIDLLIKFWKSIGDTSISNKRAIEITTEEKRQMDFIRSLINKILTTEKYILFQTDAKNNQSIFNSKIVSIGDILFTQLVIISLIFIITGELRKRKKLEDDLSGQIRQIELQNKNLDEIAWIQSHKVRAQVATILGLSNSLSHSNTDEENTFILDNIKTTSEKLDEIVREINNKTTDRSPEI